jgi:hypothetical protein
MEKVTTQLEITTGTRCRVQSGWRDSNVGECMDGNYMYICTAEKASDSLPI